MALVKLHQDALGELAGAEVEVDGTQREWLIAEGYASDVGQKPSDVDGAAVDTGEIERPKEDKLDVTTVDAKDDPTLAINREDPDELDAAGLEDDASNSDAAKLAHVTSASPDRQGPATQHRQPERAENPSDAGTQEYDGTETPTAGPRAIPVDGDAPIPAVADLSTATQDDEASEA